MYKSNKFGHAAVAAVLVTGLMLAPAPVLAQTSATDVPDTTVTITGVNEGDTVKAYRVFDADIDATNNLTYSTTYTLPEAYDSVAKLEGKDGRTVANAIAPIVTAGTPAVQGKAQGGTSVSLTLDSGYYLVTITTTSGKTVIYQTMLVNASPDVKDGKYVSRELGSQQAKSQPVTAPDKTILPAAGGDGVKETDTYSVGDTAHFQIDATIPSYPSDATKVFYSVTDVPDAGLAVDVSSFKVYDGEGLVHQLDAGDYTVAPGTKDGKAIYTVTFSPDYIKSHTGAMVRVKYDAEVKSINLTTGQVGNKAYGTFTPNPYDDTKVETDEADPINQTYGFTFRKLQPGGQPLAKAEFTVTDADGNAVTYIDADGTLHTDGKVKSDSNGYVYVNGLKAGTYTVKETGVPAGFQAIPQFTVTLDEADTGNSPATDVDETNFDITTPDKTDPKQGVLPTTGGAGTAALTAVGTLLVAGGIVVVFRSRKQD